MEITRLQDLQAGSQLDRLIMAKNISFTTEEKILSPLLNSIKKKSKEQHYRTVLLLSDMLEQSETETDFLNKMRERFPDFMKDK